eukprot:CAMPEP_0114683618 /NCGR_PEP_ID=MMETSP0191-20121206/58050_1 /TAXON_ID=126664 /ORGANISM="Sorites sp." /LENGTH=139 /DNA_ID=CAMNT_0001965065 /DNA_START=847 /DNA_END=1263 /DNA_ORIENTATION=-
MATIEEKDINDNDNNKDYANLKLWKSADEETFGRPYSKPMDWNIVNNNIENSISTTSDVDISKSKSNITDLAYKNINLNGNGMNIGIISIPKPTLKLNNMTASHSLRDALDLNDSILNTASTQRFTDNSLVGSTLDGDS